MRAAEALLAAEREEDVLEAGTRLLGEFFGYSIRYLVLREGDSDRLAMARAEGPGSERPEVRNFRTVMGSGLTGIAAQNGELLNVPDVRADPRYLGLIPGCASKICLPLAARGSVLGVLAIESTEKNSFSASDEELLTAYAQLLALALGHVRADAQRKRDISELQAVNLVAEKATRFDLQTTLDTAVEAFQGATTSNSTVIYLWDERHADLRRAAIIFDPHVYPPDYGERLQRVRRLEEGLVGWAAKQRQSVLIDDVSKDPRPKSSAGIPVGSESAIAVPLIVEGKLYGVIRALKRGTASFSADQFRLAQTIASQVALAIAAVEVHQEQGERLSELMTLQDISTRLAEVSTLDQVLDSVLDGAIRVTGAEAGLIWRRGDDKLFTLAATRNIPVGDLSLETSNRPTSLSNEMLRSGMPIRLDDLQDDSRPTWKGMAKDYHATIGVPLRSDGQMYGSLFVLHRDSGFFHDDHVRRVQVIAAQAGAALSRARAFEEAQRLSITDELTGFFNARYLHARLGEEVLRAQRYGQEMALVMIDSDALKRVNDRLGHEAGNRHLVELARTIRQHVRSMDIVTRYGGDEFVVLQPEAGLDAGRATAERIRQAASSPVGDLATSVSCGVAAFPANARDAHALFRAADQALLEAKARGKNAVVVAR